jgi:hypothetical protein
MLDDLPEIEDTPVWLLNFIKIYAKNDLSHLSSAISNGPIFAAARVL